MKQSVAQHGPRGADLYPENTRYGDRTSIMLPPDLNVPSDHCTIRQLPLGKYVGLGQLRIDRDL